MAALNFYFTVQNTLYLTRRPVSFLIRLHNPPAQISVKLIKVFHVAFYTKIFPFLLFEIYKCRYRRTSRHT